MKTEDNITTEDRLQRMIELAEQIGERESEKDATIERYGLMIDELQRFVLGEIDEIWIRSKNYLNHE